jgi:hypothetical protein
MIMLPTQHCQRRVLKIERQLPHKNKHFSNTLQTKFSHRSTRINYNTMFPTRPFFTSPLLIMLLIEYNLFMFFFYNKIQARKLFL